MKNILIILLLFISISCTKQIKPYTYKIMYLESETVAYTNKIQQFESFPEDAVIYKYINGKYIQIIQIYE
jgi:hypothetical protein